MVDAMAYNVPHLIIFFNTITSKTDAIFFFVSLCWMLSFWSWAFTWYSSASILGMRWISDAVLEIVLEFLMFWGWILIVKGSRMFFGFVFLFL